MTIQRADARFVLSHPVDSVAVLGPREGWEQALAMAGVPVTGVDSGPDLVVASTGAAGEALASGARSVLVEGRVRARPAPADPPRRRLLTLPALDEPRLIVPLDQRASLRYALGVLARRRWRRARGRCPMCGYRLVGGAGCPECGAGYAVSGDVDPAR